MRLIPVRERSQSDEMLLQAKTTGSYLALSFKHIFDIQQSCHYDSSWVYAFLLLKWPFANFKGYHASTLKG